MDFQNSNDRRPSPGVLSSPTTLPLIPFNFNYFFINWLLNFHSLLNIFPVIDIFFTLLFGRSLGTNALAPPNFKSLTLKFSRKKGNLVFLCQTILAIFGDSGYCDAFGNGELVVRNHFYRNSFMQTIIFKLLNY